MQEVAKRLGLKTVLLASDDPEPYETLPPLLPGMRVVWVPLSRWVLPPRDAKILASKVIENTYWRSGPSISSTNRAMKEGDEGEILLAQALLLARFTALVGTLTSNYLLLVHEMAFEVANREDAGAREPPEMIDLDGNVHYPCSAREMPPWGPEHGRSRRYASSIVR